MNRISTFLDYEIRCEQISDRVYTASAENSRARVSGYYSDTPEKVINLCRFGALKHHASTLKQLAIIVQSDIQGLVFRNLKARTLITQEQTPIRLLQVFQAKEAIGLAKGNEMVIIEKEEKKIELKRTTFNLGCDFYLFVESVQI